MVIAREQKEGSDYGGGDSGSDAEANVGQGRGEEEEELLDYSDDSDEDEDQPSAPSDVDDPKSTREHQLERSRAPSPTSSTASELAKAVSKLDITAPLPPPAQVHEGDPGDGGEGDVTMTLPPSRGPLDALSAPTPAIVRDIVAGDLVKQQRRQQAKHHAKKGGAGRSKGSKMRQDTRVDLNKGGYWE